MDLLKWLRRSEPKEVPAASLGPLQIVKPWARSSSSRPDIAGGFMTVVNEGETDRLVAATCIVASSVDIQAIRVKGSRLEMRKIDGGLVIPPANQQILKPALVDSGNRRPGRRARRRGRGQEGAGGGSSRPPCPPPAPPG